MTRNSVYKAEHLPGGERPLKITVQNMGIQFRRNVRLHGKNNKTNNMAQPLYYHFLSQGTKSLWHSHIYHCITIFYRKARKHSGTAIWHIYHCITIFYRKARKHSGTAIYITVSPFSIAKHESTLAQPYISLYHHFLSQSMKALWHSHIYHCITIFYRKATISSAEMYSLTTYIL
jgi:hypothetical protein